MIGYLNKGGKLMIEGLEPLLKIVPRTIHVQRMSLKYSNSGIFDAPPSTTGKV